MNYLNKFLLFAVFLFLTLSASAQISVQRTAISTTGHNLVQSESLSASATVGETVIGTSIHGTITLTAGFQQEDKANKVAVKQPDQNIDFKVFPNPSFGEFTIQTQHNSDTHLNYQIFNSNGQQITLNKENLSTTSQHNTVLNLSNHPFGTYFLIIRNKRGEKIGNIKIIKAD